MIATSSELSTLLSGTERVLVLSPHLDDAALSCGGLLASAGNRIDVVTVFTEAGPAPHTRAARSFLRQCAADDPDALYQQRRAEDREVLSEVGAVAHHLGHTDALFRRRRSLPGSATVGRVLPELVHRYPTYRFDIARGRRSRGDRALTSILRGHLEELCERGRTGLTLCPAGVGRHVDHLIVRDLGALLPGPVAYYSDFPYDQNAGPEEAFVARGRLRPWTFADGREAKARLIRGYRTQVDALFPDGAIPAVPDTFYVAAS